MSTADDGTQRRIIEALLAHPQDPSDTDIAGWLGISKSMWSDVKSGRRVLAPWMLKRIAKRLGDAKPVAEEIVNAASQQIERPEITADTGTAAAAVTRVRRCMGLATVALADVTGPESDGGLDITPDEWTDLDPEIEALEAALERLKAHRRQVPLTFPGRAR